MNSFVKIKFAVALAVGLAAVLAPAQTGFNIGKQTLCFEANHGQTEAIAPFIAHGQDSEFLISATSAQFVLRKSSGQTAAVRMQFVGANAAARISGDAEISGKFNYLVGNNPAHWQSGVPAFAQVRVENLYPGVNVVYYGNGRQLEYDFDLAPGIDPQTIALRFEGAEKISVNPQGALVVSLNGGEIIQHPPVVYQNTGAARREISGGYRILDAHTVTFALGNYDRSLPLVIDPVLSYSTYFGGNYGDNIRALALGHDGSIYVAGETLSTVFTNAPTGGLHTNFQGGTLNGDAFVAKFDNAGSNLIYFTYLGGSSSESAYGIKVDKAGNAYVAGWTDSPDFPTNNALFPHIAGQVFAKLGHYPADSFIAELNPTGSALKFSSFLGGSAFDFIKAIDLDSAGNIYVTGYTSSTNLPVTSNALQKTFGSTNTYPGFFNCNAFVAEIATGGTNLNYCSYLGGINYDQATGIALDAAGNIYVTGFTASTNFPATNGLPGFKHLNGTTNQNYAYDAFVTKFKPGFAGLVYSTLLGGTNSDIGSGIAVDTTGNAYVVGWTVSTNFPYTNIVASFKTNLTSFVRTNTLNYLWATNSFLSEIRWNGTNATLAYSLTFGGYGVDVANGVALDAAGNVFVVGSATSTNFPVTPYNLSGYLRPTNSSANNNNQPTTSDVFIMAFSNDFSGLIYSAYLGGNGNQYSYGGGNDYGNAIAVDPAGNAYIAGQTMSTNFPTLNARQTVLDSTNDAFLAKILLHTQPPVLSIRKLDPTNALVSWPGFLPEFALETRTNLAAGNPWTPVPQTVVVSNYADTVTVPATNRAAVFRLHKF